MILTGEKIIKEVDEGRIYIEPFELEQVNPNSYNFTLGNKILVYTDKILDVKKKNKTKTIVIPPEGTVLEPSKIYLGHTQEVMGSNHYVPIIRGRSSVGRLGIFINITADLIDIGSINQWTLQIHVVQPVKVYPGMHIGQVTFWEVDGDITLYSGKYQASRGPISSQIYKDYTSNP